MSLLLELAGGIGAGCLVIWDTLLALISASEEEPSRRHPTGA